MPYVKSMQVDHIGYVVKNIEKALIEFEKLGYEKCSTFLMTRLEK